MNTTSPKLIEKIRDSHERLSSSEKKIVEMILRDTTGFSLKSMGDLAKDLGLSKTTLMRFAQKMGFKGYADFRRVLQEEEVLDRSPSEKLQFSQPPLPHDRISRLRDMEFYNIGHTLEQVNMDLLDDFTARIISSDLYYSLGWGVSYHLADLFNLRMITLGKKVIPLRRENISLPEWVVHLSEGDVLVVYEFPKYSTEVLDTVRIAHARKVQIYLFTDSRSCPVIPYAKGTFFCSTLADTFGNSLIGPVFLINLISSEIWLELKDSASESLKGQGDILSNSRYYFS